MSFICLFDDSFGQKKGLKQLYEGIRENSHPTWSPQVNPVEHSCSLSENGLLVLLSTTFYAKAG